MAGVRTPWTAPGSALVCPCGSLYLWQALFCFETEKIRSEPAEMRWIRMSAALWCELCSGVEGQEHQSSGQNVTARHGEMLATLYCEDCRQRLCCGCGRRHTRQRFATSHRVVQLLGGVDGADAGMSASCTAHSRPLVIYCRDCDAVGCLSCLSLESHHGHGWCDVDVASQEARQSLSRHLEQVSRPRGAAPCTDIAMAVTFTPFVALSIALTMNREKLWIKIYNSY